MVEKGKKAFRSSLVGFLKDPLDGDRLVSSWLEFRCVKKLVRTKLLDMDTILMQFHTDHEAVDCRGL